MYNITIHIGQTVPDFQAHTTDFPEGWKAPELYLCLVPQPQIKNWRTLAVRQSFSEKLYRLFFTSCCTRVNKEI